jgi:hypothetical protein
MSLTENSHINKLRVSLQNSHNIFLPISNKNYPIKKKHMKEKQTQLLPNSETVTVLKDP